MCTQWVIEISLWKLGWSGRKRTILPIPPSRGILDDMEYGCYCQLFDHIIQHNPPQLDLIGMLTLMMVACCCISVPSYSLSAFITWSMLWQAFAKRKEGGETSDIGKFLHAYAVWMVSCEDFISFGLLHEHVFQRGGCMFLRKQLNEYRQWSQEHTTSMEA